MVVDDMAIIPPRKRQSILCQPKQNPIPKPNKIMKNMIVHAATIADPPTFMIFLGLNSRPKANKRKITPISAHVLTSDASVTLAMYGMWGPVRKPATI